ncbi:MAG TPA: RluA family pseudouridine synthase [Polyangiaceae bacterium]|nr:RluA family pseudouridine synthase [Polyangiaceae bacterium]
MTRIRYSDIEARKPDEIPQGSVVTVLRVPPESAGMRLDLFVQTQLKRTSRTRTQAIIRRSAFDAGGQRLRANDRVFAEQRVLLWREPWDEAPVPTDLPVLYEDPHLFAISKPAGVPVHPTARYHRNTVVKLLAEARGAETFTLAHRLDRETSGVLLLAKTRAADSGIKRQLERRVTVEKQYTALTWGVPREEAFRVDLPLEIDVASRLRVRMRIAPPGTGLTAATRFHVLGTAKGGERGYALVRCDLETGRQHQIRVHLAAVGCPVVGDKLYGPDPEIFARGADQSLTDDDRKVLELDRHALHAARLAFDHPILGHRVSIEAPLPRDLEDFWARVSQGAPAFPG